MRPRYREAILELLTTTACPSEIAERHRISKNILRSTYNCRLEENHDKVMQRHNCYECRERAFWRFISKINDDEYNEK